jgi:hypothetical protein
MLAAKNVTLRRAIIKRGLGDASAYFEIAAPIAAPNNLP